MAAELTQNKIERCDNLPMNEEAHACDRRANFTIEKAQITTAVASKSTHANEK